MKVMISGWAKRRFVFPLIKAIRAGISIERLAVSLALGITVGLIPLYGFTTLIVGCIALSLRLNFVLMQVAHYIVYPLQIALLVPFLKLGDAIMRHSDFSLSVKQYVHLFKTDFWGTMHQLWLLNLTAVMIWVVLAIPLFILLYFSIRYLARRYFVRLKYLRT
jgi:uncharacterized protein (DUF2062 family)